MKKVLVAMSGGVDSSVSAFLLKQKGYQVAGVSMCLGVKELPAGKPRCCGPQAIQDARRVADKLKIPHYLFDFSNELEEKVIKDFISEYLQGRTPNPCIECNRYLKFDLLLRKALSLGFDYLATGHYAKIEPVGDKHLLRRAKDRKKDQTYFLYPIKREFLQYILFPLADYTKEEVREIARRERLPVYDKPGSQDICFVPDGDYRKFISGRVGSPEPGLILDTAGNLLGRHKGIFFYTIGQREGLGISRGRALYVVEIDAKNNQILVGEKEDLRAKELLSWKMNILLDELEGEIFAKIRYPHQPSPCRVELLNGEAKVTFKEFQEAITPGQSIVFYKEDVVLGGGLIKEVWRERRQN